MSTRQTLAVFHGKTNVSVVEGEDGRKAYIAPGVSLPEMAKATGASGFATFHNATKHVFFLMKNGVEISRANISKKCNAMSDADISTKAKELQVCPVFNSEKYQQLSTMQASLKEVLINEGFTAGELVEALSEEGLDNQSIDSQCWVPTLCNSGTLTPLKEVAFNF